MVRSVNPNILDCSSPEGLQALWEFTGDRTKKEFATDGALKVALQNIILKFNDDCYVKLESYLGGGHWSYAFKVSGYNPETGQTTPQKMALKMTKPLSRNPFKKAFHFIEEDFKNLNADFVKEGGIYKYLHGIGEVRQTKIQNRTVTCILIPFLGDMTLESLLKETYYLERIPLNEWMQFFLKLFEKLNEFHNVTNPKLIHNDVKPENIALFLLPPDKNGLVKFGKLEDQQADFANFIDFGNAQEPYQRGFFGDLTYNSVVNGIGGMFFSGCKDRNTDIFALGATCVEIIDVLLDKNKCNFSGVDEWLLKQCKGVFEKMASIRNHWSLEKATGEIRTLMAAYEKKEAKEHAKQLSEELSHFSNNAAELLKREKQSGCCGSARKGGMFTPKEASLRTNKVAADKMMQLLMGTEVQFKSEELDALGKGDLGKIISKYRLQGKLPDKYIELERTSSQLMRHSV